VLGSDRHGGAAFGSGEALVGYFGGYKSASSAKGVS
jgi:hypothetical protein